MARFLSRDGRWRVDLIRLTATSDQRDGEWLRVHRDGFFFADYRTVTELAEVVDLAELEEALARRRAAAALAHIAAGARESARAPRGMKQPADYLLPFVERGGGRSSYR